VIASIGETLAHRFLIGEAPEVKTEFGETHFAGRIGPVNHVIANGKIEFIVLVDVLGQIAVDHIAIEQALADSMFVAPTPVQKRPLGRNERPAGQGGILV